MEISSGRSLSRCRGDKDSSKAEAWNIEDTHYRVPLKSKVHTVYHRNLAYLKPEMWQLFIWGKVCLPEDKWIIPCFADVYVLSVMICPYMC